MFYLRQTFQVLSEPKLLLAAALALALVVIFTLFAQPASPPRADSSMQTIAYLDADTPYLDPGFGHGEIVTTDLSHEDRTTDLAIQPDGKLVVVGITGDRAESGALAVLRYNPDGTLDPTFGQDGSVITPLHGSSHSPHVLIQPDGQILVGVSVLDDQTVFHLALVRYDPDGSLDPGFGQGGQVNTYLGGSYGLSCLTVRPDGKIIAVGSGGSSRGPTQLLIVHYNANGALDSNFGRGGWVTAALQLDGRSLNLALEADGRIVETVTAVDESYHDDFGVVRYNPDGSPDLTFGHAGIVITDLGGNDEPSLALVQPNGQIVVVGSSWWSTYPVSVAFVRYNPDGTLDPTFDQDGIIIQGLYIDSYVNAVAIQPDGKLVVTGSSRNSNKMMTSRYNRDGSLDTTFGTGGKSVTQVQDFAFSYPTAVIVQADGKIVVAGSVGLSLRTLDLTESNFMLLRYRP